MTLLRTLLILALCASAAPAAPPERTSGAVSGAPAEPLPDDLRADGDNRFLPPEIREDVERAPTHAPPEPDPDDAEETMVAPPDEPEPEPAPSPRKGRSRKQPWARPDEPPVTGERRRKSAELQLDE